VTQAPLIPQAEINAAAARLRPYLNPSPLIYASHYSALTGANVYFKLEMFQPTHSFKVRGAFNALLALPDDQRARGVVAASGGNHGLGVTLAATTVGVPAEIYLPESTPPHKQEAIRELGGTVTIVGEAWDDSNRTALAAAAEANRPYIHPFDNLHVMAGQATIFGELRDQLSRIDVIIASIGGGGLMSGLLSAVQHDGGQVRVYGVETIGADSMAQSVKAGQIVELPAITSIAETLGAKKTEPRQFEIVRHHAEALVAVPDRDAVAALVALLDHEKLLVEPATSCSLAALTGGLIPVQPGENVVVIVCGANVSLAMVQTYRERFGV
jgi:threonine dehydratase